MNNTPRTMRITLLIMIIK